MVEQGIYKIINLVNNKFYIGSSKNLMKRWTDHLYRLRNNKHMNKHLQNAYNKYGESSFAFVIIESNNTWNEQELREKEQKYLDYYFKTCPELFYNMAPKAVGGNSTNFSEEALRSISEKNRKLSNEELEEVKEKILLGVPKKEIAKQYNIQASTLSSILNSSCPEFTQSYITRQRILKTIQLYNSGFSYKEIAEKLNTSVTTVCDNLHNRYERYFKKPSDTLTKEQLDKLVYLYDEGRGNVIIANELGIDHKKVARWEKWIDLLRSTDLKVLQLTRPLKSSNIIIQKDSNGNILDEYQSAPKAVQQNKNMTVSGINEAIRLKRPYKGFIWERKEELNNVCPVQEVYAYSKNRP